ncbi:MAG: carboxy terminal-processing peptidase [Cyclobacteriaceae bacterium]|nr:carboxy terminal-processing peptidase [Cyclobacteriaceae bacterium]
MKKRLLLIVPAILVLASFVLIPIQKNKPLFEEVTEIPEFTLKFPVNDTIKLLYPERKNINETVLITELLKRYHYKKASLNDSLSSIILDNYLENLDNSRLYFLQSDVDSFEPYRYMIDDMLKQGNLEIPYQLFAVFKERYYERIAFVDQLLQNDFDFTKDEYFALDREFSPYPKSTEEQNELWRKYIKNEILIHILNGKTQEEAKQILVKRYDRYKTAMQQYNSSDVYQTFMNSYTESLDPHTSYFNPITAENFDIEMSKSLEGIGARLSKEGDYTIVYSIVPGGPAFKGNELHDNDKIIGVAQGDDGEMIDVVGWRNDDVVQLIRGKKGSVVRLNVLKAEDGIAGKPTIVRIVRDKINLEDARAESKVFEFVRDGRTYKLGVINIPSFYKDFKDASDGNEEFNSTTRDVKKLIADLEEKGIDGLLIDLRRNGGGALDEAVELTGLFVDHGPVVQVKDFDGKVREEEDKSNEVFYDGPLTVLTSRLSASASEIFAAAIQDYKRGVIIGERSFGKGTVQNLIGLQQYIPSEKERLGQLKLTTAKFYRVNGGSTQNLGVTPDVKLPSAFDHNEVGESAYPSALKWDRITAAEYALSNTIDDQFILQLNSKFEQRLKSDLDLQMLTKELDYIRNMRNVKEISLNESIRRKMIEEEEKLKPENNKIEGVEYSKEGISSSTANQGLKLEDVYLEEGLLILADVVQLSDV